MNKKIILSLITIGILTTNSFGFGFQWRGGQTSNETDNEVTYVNDDETETTDSTEDDTESNCGRGSMMGSMMCQMRAMLGALNGVDNSNMDEMRQIIKDSLNTDDDSTEDILDGYLNSNDDTGSNYISPIKEDSDGNIISTEDSKKRLGEYLTSDYYGWNIVKNIENEDNEKILAKETYLTNAMLDVQTIFTDAKIQDSCADNYNIVVSDGIFNQDNNEGKDYAKSNDFTNPYTIAENLTNLTRPVETLALSFTEKDLKLYNLLAENGSGDLNIDTPFYADNTDELFDKILKAMTLTIDKEYTLTSPVLSTEIGNDTSLFQSSFLIKPDNQWEGELKKYIIFDTVDENGTTITNIGDGETPNVSIWNAGEILFNRDLTNNPRNIYTFIDGEGKQNFTTSNENITENDLNIETKNKDILINWVTGFNELNELDYPEDGNRWVMGDVYHSNVKIYNTPNDYISTEKNRYESNFRLNNDYATFIENNQRSQKIIVGSNDGMIHIFDGETGNEDSTIIPPFMLNKLEKMINREDNGDIIMNKSNSISGIDGNIIIKDIYNGEEWKTILIANAGEGYNAFTIMDITDITNIKHIFSVENAQGSLNIWKGENADLTHEDSDYSNLSKLISAPKISLIPNENGDLEFKLILSNGNKTVPQILIIDPKTGNINKTIDIENSVVSDMTSISAESTTMMYSMKGVILFYTDTKGSLYKLNLTDYENFTLYDTDKVFDIGLDTLNTSFTKPTPFIETINNVNVLNIAFGTGDFNRLDEATGTQNYLIKIIDNNFPFYNNTFSETSNDLEILDLEVLNYDSDNSEDLCSNNTITEENETILTKGFAVSLRNQDLSTEKLFQNILVKDHNLFFTTYENRPCSTGLSYLYSLDSVCGSGNFGTDEDDSKSIIISSGVSSNVVSNKDQILIGTNEESVLEDNNILKQSGNLLYGDAVGASYIPIKVMYSKELEN